MFRISEIASSDQTITLRFEGQLIGQWVAEARRIYEEALENERRLILDLSHVSFLDREAAGLLREMLCRGVRLVNCSPFLNETLKTGDNR